MAEETTQPKEPTKLYRHIYYDASQELIRFNYMKRPNVMLVFNEWGDFVDAVSTDKEPQ